DLDLNPRFLADFFIAGKSTPSATPFRSISNLPAGQLLISDPSGRRTMPTWQLKDGPKLFYSDHQDYVDHFRDLLRRGVRATMPSDGDVWCDLSGGLDSSSITALTAEELGNASRERLSALSVVFEETTGSDESRWAREVAATSTLKRHLEVSGDQHRAFQDLAEGAAYWDVPSLEIMSYSLHRTLSRSLQDGGARALLKGLGAEFVIFGEAIPPFHMADHLRRFELSRLRRELKTWQKATRKPYASLLFQHAIRPLLMPSSITIRPYNGVPDWIDRGFAKRMEIDRRADRAWFGRRFRSVPDQWQYEQLRRLPTSLHPGCFHKTCAIGMPFLYRPLVELSLRIPWEHKVRVGTNKILLREAMAGILPERVRTRTQPVTGTPAIYRAMRDHWPALRARIEKGRLAELGLADTGRLLAAANQARHGGTDFLAGVLRPIVLDAWLDARLGDRRPLTAAAA
ncbi:MAG: asparagine synthase-related protein, partial [Acidobacteriota bacterium]